MDDILKCYQTLDLAPGAPAPQVRRAYIHLLRVWDPDRYLKNPPLRERAAEKRREIEAAYQAIREFLPELRRPAAEGAEETPIGPEPEDALILEEPGFTGKSAALLLIAFVTVLTAAVALWLLLRSRSGAG